MATQAVNEVYTKSPILLAVLQVRYEKIKNYNSKNITNTGFQIKKEYPAYSEQIIQNIRIDQGAKQGDTKVLLDSSTPNGVLFTSVDGDKTLNVGIERFTLETNGKYPGWESFKEEGRKLWNLFKKDLVDFKLTGVSIRFVNKFDLPGDIISAKDYFNTYIEATVDLGMSDFMFRYSSIDYENGIKSNIAHALQPTPDLTFQYMLDLDIIYINENIAENEIWDRFDALSFKKSSIFNQTLTEKAKDLIR